MLCPSRPFVRSNKPMKLSVSFGVRSLSASRYAVWADVGSQFDPLVERLNETLARYPGSTGQ